MASPIRHRVGRNTRERRARASSIFGRNPTILDAVATTLVARLMDVQRNELVDDTMRSYTLGVLTTDEWRRTTQGRRTVYDASMGRLSCARRCAWARRPLVG
jgi:hypothetical protein